MDSQLVQVNQFSKLASECTNIFRLGNHPFVDLDRVVDECVEIIYDQIQRETNSDYRVPPLVLMRFAQPVMISFNGSGSTAFISRDEETQTQAILRTIALQLGVYTPEEAVNLVVDQYALDQHLGDNVVLLVDELNNLGTSLEKDAARLLREMFLDKAGRFLVFTSHFPVSIEPNRPPNRASDFLGNANDVASIRGVTTVNMSLARTLQELRNMSTKCEGLTEEAAAWLGYIPSLIYSSMNAWSFKGDVTPSQRFIQMKIVITTTPLDVLQRFVKELLLGQRDPVVTNYYGTLASVGVNSLVL